MNWNGMVIRIPSNNVLHPLLMQKKLRSWALRQKISSRGRTSWCTNQVKVLLLNVLNPYNYSHNYYRTIVMIWYFEFHQIVAKVYIHSTTHILFEPNLPIELAYTVTCQSVIRVPKRSSSFVDAGDINQGCKRNQLVDSGPPLSLYR